MLYNETAAALCCFHFFDAEILVNKNDFEKRCLTHWLGEDYSELLLILIPVDHVASRTSNLSVKKFDCLLAIQDLARVQALIWYHCQHGTLGARLQLRLIGTCHDRHSKPAFISYHQRTYWSNIITVRQYPDFNRPAPLGRLERSNDEVRGTDSIRERDKYFRSWHRYQEQRLSS